MARQPRSPDPSGSKVSYDGESNQRRAGGVSGQTSATSSVPPASVTDYQSFQDTDTTGRGSGGDHARASRTQGQHQTNEGSSGHGNDASGNSSAVSIKYRGFSTSINGMFTNPENERVDCCAITCCGVLQSDRDRFLIQGVKPPGVLRRLLLHLVVPGCLFVAAGLAAKNIGEPALNFLITNGMVILFVAYLVVQCYKGRSKKVEIRKDLLWTKYQIIKNHGESDNAEDGTAGSSRHRTSANIAMLLEQERPYDDEEWEASYNVLAGGRNSSAGGQLNPHYLGQRQSDFGSAHPCCLCACYPIDLPQSEWRDSTAGGGRDNNLCASLWTALCCCGARNSCVGYYLQCCGMCAVAQEGRELEKAILPPSYRRIDYVTMQPVSEYYPAVYNHTWKRPAVAAGSGNDRNGPSTSPILDRNQSRAGDRTPSYTQSKSSLFGSRFLPPLSRLSIRLVQCLAGLLLFLLFWSVAGPQHWAIANGNGAHRHMFGLSDFVIFCATWFLSLVLLSILTLLCNWIKPSRLSYDAMIKYYASGFFLSTTLAIVWELICGVVVNVVVSLTLVIFGVDVVDEPDVYTSTWIGFGGGGEHGLTSLLDDTSPDSEETVPAAGVKKANYAEAFGKNHPVLYTFYLALSAFILAALIEELCKYFSYRMVEHPDFMTQKDLQDATSIALSTEDDDNDEEDSGAEHADPELERRRTSRRQQEQQEHHMFDYSNQLQSKQAQGAAITLAMICVAMGFTCAENLVYVFVYSSSSAKMELIVLIARSFFPVHPVAAAMQSIGVVERDVEQLTTTKLGWIVLPAVLFHGGYDFFIMWIDFLSSRDGNVQENDDDAVNTDNVGNRDALAVISSFLMSLTLMVTATMYFLTASSKQRRRLAALDQQNAVDNSRLI